MAVAPAMPYPVSLSVDYPDRDLNRLTTFFRIVTVIPIGIILGLLSYGFAEWPDTTRSGYHVAASGLLFLPTILMLLFRRKYPRWWFDWNLELLRFSYRVTAYLLLLRDKYPSTDDEQSVHLAISYPDAHAELNRWLPLIKWLLVIPHYIVLFFLDIAGFVCVVIAWFAILITGRYPSISSSGSCAGGCGSPRMRSS